MNSRPNILIIMTDQMRSSAMNWVGQEEVSTPHLDAFSKQGIRYTNAVSNTPACTPARASLLTGLHVLQHGLINNEMSLGPHHTSLAHALGGVGYDCSYIGKWHVDGVNRGAFIPKGPRRQGFDHYWAGIECNHGYFQGYHYDDVTRQPIWFNTYEPEGQTALATEYLNSRGEEDSPFCMVLSWGPPHCPYRMAPKRFRDMYPPESITLRPNAVDAKILNWEQGEGEAADAYKKEQVAGYYAHVSALDECFGTMMTCLDNLGLSDNTIVVFTSDHGDMLFSQDRGWKTKPWRESVGIPLLMRWPGRIAADQESRLPISLVDIMPTLLGLAGAAIPEAVQGLDLSWHPLGQEGTPPESSYTNFVVTSTAQRHQAWRGVVTERHTYAETREGGWILYDDIEDPYQMNNLVGNADAEALQQRLHHMIQNWLIKTDDDFADSVTMAERYMKGRHIGCVIPIPDLEPIIQHGQEARKHLTY